jgi:hypothetical protein
MCTLSRGCEQWDGGGGEGGCDVKSGIVGNGGKLGSGGNGGRLGRAGSGGKKTKTPVISSFSAGSFRASVLPSACFNVVMAARKKTRRINLLGSMGAQV